MGDAAARQVEVQAQDESASSASRFLDEIMRTTGLKMGGTTGGSCAGGDCKPQPVARTGGNCSNGECGPPAAAAKGDCSSGGCYSSKGGGSPQMAGMQALKGLFSGGLMGSIGRFSRLRLIY